MRSKNQVPVQVILPPTSMGSNHSSKKGAFEEALQSSIEASLRSTGTAPSRVFSFLYNRSRPYSGENRPGPSSSLTHNPLLPPPDNADSAIDVKPDVSGLNRDLLIRSQVSSVNSEDPATNQSSPGTPSTPSARVPSVHSTVSPREQQNETRGPPPLLLSMPQSFVRPGSSVTNSDVQVSNGNRFMLQRMPSMLPKNFPLEHLKQAQVEQMKQLQQIQRWHILQQQRQQVRAAASGALAIPRIPFFNPLMPPSPFNRNALVKPGTSINGIHGPTPEQVGQADPTSPGSPMFRKGFCKEGRDIRLSTLKRDGTTMAPFPSEYVLVAMSISPTSPQVPTTSGAYQHTDLQSEAMVVVAISLKCLPPNEMTKPFLAQCIGCGDGTLHSFAALSSHLNLRTSSPSQVLANTGMLNPLQRYARYYVIKDTKMPHGCLQDVAIQWRVNGNGGRVSAGLPQLVSMYISANQQAVTQRNPSHALNPNSVVQRNRPRTNLLAASQSQRPQLKYKASGSTEAKPQLTQSAGTSTVQPDMLQKTQPTTSSTSPILIDSPISGPSSHSPTSDNTTQHQPSRLDPDWNSTVKLSENLPPYVGRPLILICWEWQQLQSNIQNVNISHSYTKCYEEAMSDCHDRTIGPLTRELCYMVTSQYLCSIGDGEFPTPCALSAWLGRARLMLASMRLVQVTTAHAVTLARMTIINHPHKIGLVVSQISQAHAINECIANLRPNGPSYHIIAHINGDTILDLCILLTGHVSRLTREHLLTQEEYFEHVDRTLTSESLSVIQERISIPHVDNCIANLASTHSLPNHDIRTSFLPMTHQDHPTSTAFSYDQRPSQTIDNTGANSPSTSSPSVATDDKPPSDENNNLQRPTDHSSSSADWIAEQLFTHFSSLCESNKLDLSLFTSVQCSFLLPPSPVSQFEVIGDITASGVMQELGVCSSKQPSQTDLRKVIFTATSKTKQRFSALCEHVKVNTSTLFVIFHLDAHLHCDSNSVGSEWMSSLSNDLLSSCPNFLVVSCTHIPQALLNQNTSVSSENILFCSRLKHESANPSITNHCSMTSSQEIFRNMTFDLHHETKSLSVLNSLPQFHSAAVNTSMLIRSYIAALALVVSSFQVLSTGKNVVPDGDKLQELTSPTTFCIVKELVSSTLGVAVLLRAPSESVAAKIVSDISEARRKLRMHRAFEIMLYGSHMKPRVSEYFLSVIRKHKRKPDEWTPDTLAEIDCIPLLLVYTGKDLPSQRMPSSLRYVDLRLSANSVETLSQSHILSETALISSVCKIPVSSTSSATREHVDEPPSKKLKSENGGSSESDDFASVKNNKLSWKMFDEPEDNFRKLSNGRSSESDEFSSEEDEKATSRKRGHMGDQMEASPAPRASQPAAPCTILPKTMCKYVESLANGSEKFTDLPPHHMCEWSSHARPIINEKLTETQMSDYLRKWVRPLAGHPDCRSPGLEQPQGVPAGSPRHILLVTPPHMPVSLSCCIFMKKMHRMLVKLLQVAVYDHKFSSRIKPCYPMPNSHHVPQWPIHSTILDMDFDANMDNCLSSNCSRITNGVQDPVTHEAVLGSHRDVPTALCMAGKRCALDVSHRACVSCRTLPDSQAVMTHQLSLPNRGVNQHTVCDGSLSLDLQFCIPESESHHFVFQFQEKGASALRALNLFAMHEVGPKTPVFSLGISGARHGLYNLDHTLYGGGSDDDRNSATEADSGDTAEKPRPLHVIVVHCSKADEFKLCWPNSVLMVLPENFNDLGIGAMKYAVQCVMQHSVGVKQEQHNAFQEESSTGDIWPFAVLLDDAAVVWMECKVEESVNRSMDIVIADLNRTKSWKNTSLLETLMRIETVPCAERYAAIGFRPWGSQMEVTECEEDFSGEVVSSGFSKCLLTSCIAINATLTANEAYDFSRFLNEDVDWCMRVASADLPLFRFNDIAVATKVMSSTARRELMSVSCDATQALVSLADSDFTPLPHHPQLLLELHFENSGDDVFPKARGSLRHPVLVIDRYISLGPEVCVEFASSRSDASPWVTNCEKSYCGLLLYCQSGDLSQSFLQQFKFTTGATVCVVGRDRSSLRQTVVQLHLENDWHFRLTDEYQTTNVTGFRKPLYYLTGVSRSPR